MVEQLPFKELVPRSSRGGRTSRTYPLAALHWLLQGQIDGERAGAKHQERERQRGRQKVKPRAFGSEAWEYAAEEQELKRIRSGEERGNLRIKSGDKRYAERALAEHERPEPDAADGADFCGELKSDWVALGAARVPHGGKHEPQSEHRAQKERREKT